MYREPPIFYRELNVFQSVQMVNMELHRLIPVKTAQQNVVNASVQLLTIVMRVKVVISYSLGQLFVLDHA